MRAFAIKALAVSTVWLSKSYSDPERKAGYGRHRVKTFGILTT